jgi:hypothetical protein
LSFGVAYFIKKSEFELWYANKIIKDSSFIYLKLKNPFLFTHTSHLTITFYIYSYTQMFNAKLFPKTLNIEMKLLQPNTEDRPLIVQFCANNQIIYYKQPKWSGINDVADLNLDVPSIGTSFLRPIITAKRDIMVHFYRRLGSYRKKMVEKHFLKLNHPRDLQNSWEFIKILTRPFDMHKCLKRQDVLLTFMPEREIKKGHKTGLC